jgi:flagellar basal body-associated protein FliL
MRNYISNKILSCYLGIKEKMEALKNDSKGAEAIQILIAILIVIIIGGIVVAILRVAAPQIVNDVIARIRSVFEL